jgi:hypothetical protein
VPGYWWCVVCRAFRDAGQVVGHNLKKTVMSYVSTVVAFGIYGYVERGQKVFGKIEWWLSTILGGCVVFVVILLYQILAAPQKLQNESVAKAKSDFEKLRAHVDEIQASFDESHRLHEAQLAASAAEVKILREQLHDRRDKKAIFAELNRLIGQGVDLQNKVKASHQNNPPTEFNAPVQDWLQQAFSFVESYFPDYTGHFRSDAGVPPQGYWPGSVERAELINFISRRLSRLSELLSKM